MRISLFGSLGETIGRDVTIPPIPNGTVAQVRQALIARYPDAEPLLRRRAVRAWVDDRPAGEDEEVPDGAEIAFFPPLSGG